MLSKTLAARGLTWPWLALLGALVFWAVLLAHLHARVALAVGLE